MRPDLRARRATSGAVPATEPAAPPPGHAAARGASGGWGWRIALALALVYPLLYIGIALLRMNYPFELEWMEGGMVGHVRRILDGQPLYVEPSLEFTPFIYPPLYFYAAAAMAKLIGVGFVPLRLLSFLASLGCIALVFASVGRRAGGLLPATLAASLFAASYREGGAWLDLARVDSLLLCLMAAGICALLRVPGPAVAGLTGGVLFGLAALTKQTALFVAAPAAVFLLVAEWRRGVPFAAAVALVFGGVSLALERLSGGWYHFYVFDLPRDHPIIGQLLRGFWTQDLLGPYAIALAFGAFHFFRRSSAWRARGLELALLSGLILVAYATKIRVGGYDNLVLPAHLAASLALGWGVAAVLECAAGLDPAPARTLHRFAAFLCAVQFVLLAYKPWRQLPTAADLDAGRQLVESLQRVPGPVWVPSHPELPVMAGKPEFAHELAITDVLRPGETPQHRKLIGELRAALRERRFGLVVLDHTGWLKDEAEPYYTHAAQMFGEKEEDLFWPRTGFYTRPDFVWAPKADSGAAAR